jgi:hypothetical protein
VSERVRPNSRVKDRSFGKSRVAEEGFTQSPNLFIL